MEDFLKVGVVTSTHGLKGEVKVYPTTDCAERFLSLPYVLVETGREKQRLDIENVRFFKNLVILQFRQYHDINEILFLKGKELWIPRELGQPLLEGEYYIADLLGMQVILEDGTEFGTLRNVMETGANDVYIIDTKEHGEVLIPAIKDCILSVDVEAGIMKIHLLKGLIE